MNALMEPVQELEPRQRLSVSPRLIEANYILGLSTAELDLIVAEELDANPALELEERATCSRCGTAIDSPYCLACKLDQRLGPSKSEWDDDVEARTGTATWRDDDDFDPMTLIASESSLIDQILSDAIPLLGPDDRPIAEYLLHSLDERGYLDASLDEMATQYHRPVAEIEAILRAVQQVAPVGVAARDLRECLMLQLAHLANSSNVTVPPVVWAIVANHLGDLAVHRYSLLARRLGVTADAICRAHDFIRSHLTPFPLQSQAARWWKAPSRTAYVIPDVVITLDTDGAYVIEVIRSRASRIRLDPLYADLARAVPGRPGEQSASDRAHIRDHVARARLFMSNIHQRADTLLRITQCLVEVQDDFVRHGVRELRPLTRAMVARRIGVHDSTVSRATAKKHLMLPRGQVIPFSTFFTASLSTKDLIKEIISQENGALTDQQICERLRLQGVRIARRTVAKYRATVGILPSTMR